MTRTLRFRPEVEEDILEARLWYESKSDGLGQEFLRVFYATTADLASGPLRYPKVYGSVRRRLLRRFPYAVYFTTDPRQVIVFAVLHCARSPRRIRGILRRRRG